MSNGGGNLAATGRSSDPKPREGTETGRRIAPGAGGAAVVRPKTPRGDGNMGYLLPARGDAVRGRQTQNPERGRKRISPATPQPRYCSMSSDPKPREGTETIMVGHGRARLSGSSDPKPREGTETCANPFGVMRMVGSGRQTQNPERGRKLHHASCHQSASSSSSDPKPREGTETLGIPCADSGFACRQTQNPERGRKLASAVLPVIAF
ncbi:Uncharacterised protein [Mycobacterium tuberculosis]|nr:Uncharacterised protein [Mycobacterium tuberculosis]